MAGNTPSDAGKAFDFAQTVVVQLLTLATAIVTITLTFFHNVAPQAGDASKTCIALAWGIYAASVLCGILALMALAGTLQKGGSAGIYSPNVRLVASLQIGTFFLALVLTIVAGVLAL